MQVLICTYGAEGIRRVAEANHVCVPGVSYLVSWQNPEGTPLPQRLQRDDFKVIESDSRGLSLNRNLALQAATDDVILISDDDIQYKASDLQRIMQLFELHPELDIVTFKHEPTEPQYSKQYPAAESFDLRHPAKGYFLTSFEMALRLKAQRQADVWFDERFGAGSPLFICGEEELFLHHLTRRGAKGRYLAETLCRHTGGATTSDRAECYIGSIEANAATKVIMHPWTWFARQVRWAFRQNRTTHTKYITASVRGAYKLFKSWITGYPKTRTCC